MSYYLLPKTNNNILYNYINCSLQEIKPTPCISYSLSNYLCELKKKIEKNEKNWGNFKKYTNPYEYIHTIIPNKKTAISKLNPLSRSYFKMIEIVDVFKIIPDYSHNMNCFHLAEGPGGFIEAMVHKRKNTNDTYVGMTLLNDKHDTNIPAWKKSNIFLQQNSNVSIETGADNTGNILSFQNLTHCKNKYTKKFEFITGDGGFDFSLDFNSQEINITQLLLAQVIYALNLQKINGCFVLKIFDCFMPHTIDIIYILSCCYQKVYFMKPHTSRQANSEKYVICKNFIGLSPHLENTLNECFKNVINLPENNYIHRFLTIPIPNFFLTKLQEFNAILGQQQIENIHYTITLINNKFKQDKLDTILKHNIQKSTSWCIKHNIEYNADI
tara:strand:- start:5051 stop:6205 length:1155 start_codon:yes stop_codon:yes gene_type:complete